MSGQQTMPWGGLVVGDLQRLPPVDRLATMRAGVVVRELAFGLNVGRAPAGPLGFAGVHGPQRRPARGAGKRGKLGYSPEMGG